MTKYDLVVYHRSWEEFLDRLRDLGLVDVTTHAWEPDERQSELLASIERYHRAIECLTTTVHKGEKPFDTADEAMSEYHRITTEMEIGREHAASLQKQIDELRHWGEFDPQQIESLLRRGVELRFFTATDTIFVANVEQWSEEYTIEKIVSANGTTYFVAIVKPMDESTLAGAQQVRPPMASIRTNEHELRQLLEKDTKLQNELNRCAASLPLIEEELSRMKEGLELDRVRSSAAEEYGQPLMVFEGWATRADAPKVEAFLDGQPDTVWIASRPTPEDDTPVLLKNKRFPRLFELIGDLYAMPKYGTMDLTPWFAPFYMLFFAFCLGDGGYGLILLLAGIFLKVKGGPKLSQAASLTMFCGGATIVFGILTASFFGIRLGEFAVLKPWTDHVLKSEQLFPLSLVLGYIQIMIALGLKAAQNTTMYGIKYALSTIGWMIVLLAGGVSYAISLLAPDFAGVFAFTSPAFMAVVGVGLVMMFFMNSPGKNIFANFGTGLWNTYNDLIGFVGDILSYIRLFALGISGGTLALVFNDVAFGLSPDIPVLRELCIIIILLIGHGINLFMSLIGSFVHPLRLTFLEFYKNAGFDSTLRRFKPFSKK